MLSIPHLIIIFVVALVVFGPEKIPELARNLGKVMAEFRRATGDLRSTFEGHLRDLEREADERRIGGASSASPAAELPPAIPAPGTVPATSPSASTAGMTETDSPAQDASSQPVAPQEDSATDDFTLGPPRREPRQESPKSAPEQDPETVSDGGNRPA